MGVARPAATGITGPRAVAPGARIALAFGVAASGANFTPRGTARRPSRRPGGRHTLTGLASPAEATGPSLGGPAAATTIGFRCGLVSTGLAPIAPAPGAASRTDITAFVAAAIGAPEGATATPSRSRAAVKGFAAKGSGLIAAPRRTLTAIVAFAAAGRLDGITATSTAVTHRGTTFGASAAAATRSTLISSTTAASTTLVGLFRAR